MTYHHLTYQERTQINALLQLGLGPGWIAKFIRRPKCTLYRELKRNSFEGFYFVDTAQKKSEERRQHASQDRDDDEELWEWVVTALKHGMSPKQAEGRMKAEGGDVMSASQIYKRVKKDFDEGGDLWVYLRRSRKTYRRNFEAAGDSRNEIRNRVSIEERAEIVDYRERTGDLEGDTMIGARHKGIILTMNDRVTKKVAIAKLDSKHANHVCDVMIKTSSKFKGKKHTCTLDNGREFAEHEEFTEATGIPVYFCHPRTPEERGSNENMNGLIRQYLPKGTDLSKVSVIKLQRVEYKLNSRPRKSLGYLTPIEAETSGEIEFHFFN